MRMAESGWVWEGEGLDPGTPPSIFGIGDGARFFGLGKCHFLFHPTSELALHRLTDMEQVVCDITKWLHKDVAGGGSASCRDSSLDRVIREAEKVSLLSLRFPNITGAIFDDALSIFKAEGYTPQQFERVYSALKAHNPDLKLWAVVYARELSAENWKAFEPYIDVVNLWVWRGHWKGAEDIDGILAKCRDIFPDKPVYLGCYLRDYSAQAPMPLSIVQDRVRGILRCLERGEIAGYTILGTVCIEGQLEAATWIRDFIAGH